MAVKIYTKTGDKGKTSLIGGKRVLKNDPKVNAYGDIDEAKSNIGLVYELCNNQEIKDILKQIMIKLFTAESLVASDSKESLAKMPQLNSSDIESLEEIIDSLNKELKPLKSFILPAGSQLIAQTHIARTVCRRAERSTIAIFNDCTEIETVLKYLNRLSDFLFILARYFAHIDNIKEVKWTT